MPIDKRGRQVVLLNPPINGFFRNVEKLRYSANGQLHGIFPPSPSGFERNGLSKLMSIKRAEKNIPFEIPLSDAIRPTKGIERRVRNSSTRSISGWTFVDQPYK